MNFHYRVFYHFLLYSEYGGWIHHSKLLSVSGKLLERDLQQTPPVRGS